MAPLWYDLICCFFAAPITIVGCYLFVISAPSCYWLLVISYLICLYDACRLVDMEKKSNDVFVGSSAIGSSFGSAIGSVPGFHWGLEFMSITAI